MRYTKIALLVFGAGLVLGLVVVVAEIGVLARVASGVMALGLVGLPIGMAVDWRAATRTASLAAKQPAKRTKLPTRRVSPAQPRRVPRTRKRAAPKR